MDDGWKQVIVLLITTGGTVAVAWIKTHPGRGAKADQQNGE